jgi:YbbR domain-containing protein
VPVGEDVKKVVTKNIPIRPDEIRGLPSGVAVEEISPSFVPVIFDEKVRVLLPVKVVTDGQPAKGYTLAGDPTAFPNQVRVHGPRSVLGKAACVETERVNIHGLARDERYPVVRLSAALPDPERNQPVPVMAEQESVAVQVRVTPEAEEQTLSLNVLVLSPPEYPYRLELYEKEIKIRVRAPKGVMTKETLEAVAAFVDARTVEPKAPVKADVKLYLPAGVVLAEGALPQVTIDKVVEK